MQTENLIALETFCVNNNIEISFIRSLQEKGLIEIINISNTNLVNTYQVRPLEKIHHYYNKLDIINEDNETFNHLLEQQNTMQNEIISLRKRLSLYETLE
jgi:chaperone modulatory protein CbpM